jgi:hypothetical protein
MVVLVARYLYQTAKRKKREALGTLFLIKEIYNYFFRYY